MPLVLIPLGSLGPSATAGAILFAVEVRELSVEGMTTEAARAESAKSERARANSLEVSGKCERAREPRQFLILCSCFHVINDLLLILAHVTASA